MRNDPLESPWIVSLEGMWSFHWSPDPWTRPIEFFRRDFDASQWSVLRVPSNWQLNGYGIPLYTNKRYPFLKDPPQRDGNAARGVHESPLEESGRILSADVSSARPLVRPPDLSSF